MREWGKNKAKTNAEQTQKVADFTLTYADKGTLMQSLNAEEIKSTIFKLNLYCVILNLFQDL